MIPTPLMQPLLATSLLFSVRENSNLPVENVPANGDGLSSRQLYVSFLPAEMKWIR